MSDIQTKKIIEISPENIKPSASLELSETMQANMGHVDISRHQVLSPGRTIKSSHGGLFGEFESLLIESEKNGKYELSAELQCLLTKLGEVKVHALSLVGRYGKDLKQLEGLLNLFKG